MKRELYEVKDEILILNLPEELDHDSAGEIRRETEYLFTCKKIRNVIFDYSNTCFMDSSGIGLVIGRYREVRYLKGNVYIVGVNSKIERILEISGLYRVAKTEPDRQSAILKINEEISNRNPF